MDEREDFIRNARLKIESLNDELEDQTVDPVDVSEERYEIKTLLGEGAAGRVWKAYDRRLKRNVALKKLRLEGTGTPERFLREARNQARVQNPNICKVFDVGNINGEPYIAMQCIEGRTLSAASTEMTLRNKVEVMRTVAEAVHAAHEAGLVHRDLKPGNILVEKAGDSWLPYITDFGLSREEDSADRTKTGMIVGTPAYMAPEQAQGNIRDIDQRTDVYALGATFYEILCGHPPFTGTSVEIALKTIQEEAPSLRKQNREVAYDLEIIVMKCLEKEPERRYYTAQALADDLSRFLEGEPILARRASWHYRIGKKARRHRKMAAILAAAFIAVIFSASFGLYNWWTAAKRAEIAQQFGQEVAEIEGFLRYTSSLPLHDIRKEKLLVQQKMQKIQNQMEILGRPALAPGNYALGRGYLALHQHDRARTHLEAAWKNDYQTPQIAYALGRVLGALYQEELEKLELLSSPEAKEARRQEIEKQFRDPAVAFLKASKNSASISSDYLDALMAFYANRYEDAVKISARAMDSAPWSYEARKLQGDIHVFQGAQKQRSGDYKGAGEDFEKAGDAYKAATEIARSDSSIYDAECHRLIQVLRLVELQGVPTEEQYAGAISVCDLALQVDPENANAWNRKSVIYSDWAVILRTRKGNPAPVYDKAIQMAKKALAIKPNFPEAWNSLGNSYVHLAYEQWDTGIERDQTIESALQAFQKAIQLKPNDESYCYLGDAYSDQAVARMEKGIDPTSSFDNSVKAYENAIRLNPRHYSNFSNLGMVLTRKGMYQLHHGKDPANVLKMAIENYRKALELNAKFIFAHNNTGVSFATLAQYEMTQALNPLPSLDQAIPAFRKAMEINPKFPLPYLVSARAYCIRAEYAVQTDTNPEPDLQQARTAIRQYMDLSGSALGSNKDEAWIELVEAEWALLKGASARTFFEKAESSLRLSLKHNPEDAETYRRFARYYLLSAKDKMSRKQNPATEIKLGSNQIAEALKRDPQWGESYALQAELFHLAARIQQQDALKKKIAIKAKNALKKAFELNQNLRGKYDKLMSELEKLELTAKSPRTPR